MRYFWILILAVLVFLAISSGISKIMQMPQDVEFFSRYGFNNPMIIGFGALQILGGALMIYFKSRIAGSVIVFLTFFLSLVLLILDGNIPFSIATVVAMVGLAAIAIRTKAVKISQD